MRTVSDPINAEDIVLEVANQAGVAVADLRGDFRRVRHNDREYPKRVLARDAAILAMRARGYGEHFIAAAIGVKQPTISIRLRRIEELPGHKERALALATKANEYLDEEKDGA